MSENREEIKIYSLIVWDQYLRFNNPVKILENFSQYLRNCHTIFAI